MPGAPFTWTKAGIEIEIGFGDFEHLAAPFSPPWQVSRLSGLGICHQAKGQIAEESGIP
jgi:hypothetical protein